MIEAAYGLPGAVSPCRRASKKMPKYVGESMAGRCGAGGHPGFDSHSHSQSLDRLNLAVFEKSFLGNRMVKSSAASQLEEAEKKDASIYSEKS